MEFVLYGKVIGCKPWDEKLDEEIKALRGVFNVELREASAESIMLFGLASPLPKKTISRNRKAWQQACGRTGCLMDIL